MASGYGIDAYGSGRYGSDLLSAEIVSGSRKGKRPRKEVSPVTWKPGWIPQGSISDVGKVLADALTPASEPVPREHVHVLAIIDSLIATIIQEPLEAQGKVRIDAVASLEEANVQAEIGSISIQALTSPLSAIGQQLLNGRAEIASIVADVCLESLQGQSGIRVDVHAQVASIIAEIQQSSLIAQRDIHVHGRGEIASLVANTRQSPLSARVQHNPSEEEVLLAFAFMD